MRHEGRLVAAACVAAILVSAAEVSAAEPAKDILWTEKKVHSYGNEEVIIRDFFQDQRGGVFVDIGCAWPIKNSNTYYLEKNLGWSGIGVDGLSEYAEGWKKHRPNSVFLNLLVTERSDSPEKFYKSAMWGMSTAEPEVAARVGVVGQVEIPGITLDDLLERNGVTQLDLVSIDVEGHQKSVLAGFDIARWKPKLVCIEDEGPISVEWFRQRGYAPIERYRARDVANWYFAPKELAEAANARQTQRGREELQKRASALAAEPPDSALRSFVTPMYVLDQDGRAVRNPEWKDPSTMKAASPVDVRQGGDAVARPAPVAASTESEAAAVVSPPQQAVKP